MADDHSVQGFKSYIWTKQDVIGAGATSFVYKGICQNTGNCFAVKVFNEQARARSLTIQQRELELLCRINHENVVKLIDKDEQVTPHRYSLRLIVMEYCNGGSLSTLIEEPENIYGLQQSEFLLVLKHITDGMSELHRLNIVHRDIKPNNILLQILPTGEHVYKLSDFGAAREVAVEDEQFMSICGTEEYLFPDVYERALINRNVQTAFRPGIDLWSTGVSLYHVATGMLPFRPIGGRSNRPTMIQITRAKPSGCISGVQSPVDGQIEYSNRLPETCQLSKNLQDLLVPMLAGLMENNYEKMWSFKEFFDHSNYISSLRFVNVMNLDTCQIIELPFDKNAKLSDFKKKIERETKIEMSSQLIIYNNLLIDSLVTETQPIETYPLMDKEHPCILFSIESSLTCDNLEIIKSIPNIRCKEKPQKMSEILYWSKETCGSIYYIKREIYLVTMIIELLKLSAIAFKSYMPEMKLKNQNLLHNFKSSVKSLETKMSIIERLDDCLANAGLSSSHHATYSYAAIKHDIRKFQDEIYIYESEINCLTNKINEIQNLEFLIQNSSQTSRWKKEADAYTATAQKTHDEFLTRKREMRYRADQEQFEKSKFTEFKIGGLTRTKEEAVKLYQEVIIVHFYDFYLRFEKWMSDLIKLHNDIMSVQKKLIDCERDMNSPFELNERLLDARIAAIADLIAQKQQPASVQNNKTSPATQIPRVATTPTISTNNHHYLPATPSNTLSSSSFSATPNASSRENIPLDTPPMSSTEIMNTSASSHNPRPSAPSGGGGGGSVGNSLEAASVSSTASSSRISRQNMESIVASLREFKLHAGEIERALDENGSLLKYLQDQFQNNPNSGTAGNSSNSSQQQSNNNNGQQQQQQQSQIATRT